MLKYITATVRSPASCYNSYIVLNSGLFRVSKLYSMQKVITKLIPSSASFPLIRF